MKILHLNYTDIGGGAAIATLNLVKEQNKNGIDARIGVIQKKTVSPFVFSIVNKKFIMNLIDEFYFGVKYVLIYLKFLNSISPFLFFKTTNGIQHSKNNKTLADIKWINNPDFDIVHLHWINCDMLFVNDIAKIKKPNVLENDNRYQSGYYRNSKSKSMHGIDLCRKVWNKKKKYLNNKEILFISPSTCERDCLKQGKFFSNTQCFVIPNIIQKDIFRSLDKVTVKDIFKNLNDKKIIGFGVTVLNGVTIGEGAIIGAQSVVREDIPPYSIAYGNPARVVKYIKSE